MAAKRKATTRKRDDILTVQEGKTVETCLADGAHQDEKQKVRKEVSYRDLPGTTVALELGTEEAMDFEPPMAATITGVVISAQGEPWWEEAAWSYGCKVVTHIVTGDGAACIGSGANQNTRITRVKGWKDGWNKIRSIKPNVVFVEGKLAAAGRSLIAARPDWLKLVVASSAATDSQMVGQKLTTRHAEVGGVTDRHDKMEVWLKLGSIGQVQQATGRQDLRAVLKAGISGRSAAPLEGSGSSIGQRVNYIRPHLVSSRGLLPVKNLTAVKRANLHVRTVFGAGLWTDRRLEPAECLMAHDVSEAMFKTLTDDDQNTLRGFLGVPLRTRVEIGKLCRPEIHKMLQTRKRKDRACPDPPAKRQAVHDQREPVQWVEDKPTVWTEFEEEGYGRDETAELDKTKATKSDSSPVPHFYWNKFLLRPFSHFIMDRDWKTAAQRLRSFFWKSMRRNKVRSFTRWKNGLKEKGLVVSEKSVEAARDAIGRYANGNWWNWSRGSRPFFWEWPEEFQESLRDGIKLWFRTHLEPYTKAQKKPLTMDEWEKVREKLNCIRDRGYVEAGVVESLTNFFCVPKGEDDIRMVYDGTASGLNDALWAPWFPLPTVESLLRAVEPGTYMCDTDVGEMFLNFMLHEEVRKMCGVDFTLYYPEEVGQGVGNLWERWCRCAMGLTTSPYQAIQGMMWAKELMMGNRLDESNVFRWSKLQMNLPGMTGYDPTKMWLCKVRKDDTVACDVFIYCDDCRYTGPTETECWKAAQRGSSILGKLGIQNAARKTRPPERVAGAWQGAVVHSDQAEVAKLVTQVRWTKTRKMIRSIQRELLGSGESKILHRATLGSQRGFLVYVARTYDFLKPYLKGIHATMESWRPDRDAEGWKIKNFEWDFDPDDMGPKKKEGVYRPTYSDGPVFVKAVPRLFNDLLAMIELTSAEEPPRVVVRSKGVAQARYGFGDASGLGYGSAVNLNGRTLRVRVGTWKWTISQEKSSNWRELRNLVELVKDLAKTGKLRHCELFLFTDNSVAERAYFKGTSSSQSLFELVLELRKLTLTGEFKLHVIHVPGTRMIECGVDGASRSDLSTGVMRGTPMLEYVPLHLSALERSDSLLDYIKSWLPPHLLVKSLSPEEWFDPFVKGNVHVWTPPPAAADLAVELLAEGIHKRPNAFHVFVVPRLMTVRWRKVLGRATDVLFHLPPKLDEIWAPSQHEPLTIAFAFPLSESCPWQMGNFPQVKTWETELRSMCKNDPSRAGDRVQQLWKSACALGSL